MTPEMLLILAAESFCLTSQPWWRLSTSQPRERSTRVEVRACHHLDMIVVEEVEEETGGETMADLGHQSRDTSNLGMTGTDEDQVEEVVDEMTITVDHQLIIDEEVTMMMVGEEVTEAEEEGGEEVGTEEVIMMMTMEVVMTMVTLRGERTRKTSFPIILSMSHLKTTPWPPGHCSLVTWSST